VRYVYLVLLVICFVAGGFVGHRIFPRTELREIPITVTKTQTVTKEIERFPDGKIVERVVTQTRDKTKASPQPPKPEYRAGILMPVASELKLPTVTAGKRLFGDVWLDAQFNTGTQSALVGVSVEF
jgi:hypothetical protein